MEPNGLAAGSSDSTGGQTEALNQNRAHREHTLESRAVLPTILGTDSAVGTPGIGVGLEGLVREMCQLSAGAGGIDPSWPRKARSLSRSRAPSRLQTPPPGRKARS
jgi:hypothetical protein